MTKVLSNATGVDTLISSATIPMTDKFSFHCPPEGDGDTDARPSLSDSESDGDQDLADVTLSGSVGDGEGKATQHEETTRQQRYQDLNEKLNDQTNGFAARPTDELHDGAASSKRKDFDFSVGVSMLTPLITWVFGREYIKNIIVAIFLLYYLHQLIEVPWQLYHASRRRRPVPGIPPPQTSNKGMNEFARAELWRHEMSYLCLAALGPFLGAFLLKTVILAVFGEDAAPWFSTTIFFLASLWRPWRHIIGRLRDRVRSLHEAIHYPSPESQLIADSRIQTILDHVGELERELDRVKRTMVLGHALREAHDEIFDALEDVERTVKKQEKKLETSRTVTETRLADLEATIGRFETEGKMFDQPGSVLKRLLADLTWLPRQILDVLPFIQPSKSTAEKGKGSTVTANSNYHSYSPPSRRPPRLETIPENGDPTAVFVPSNGGNSPRTVMRRRRPTRYPESPKESDSPLALLSQAILLPYHLSVRLLTAIPPIKSVISSTSS